MLKAVMLTGRSICILLIINTFPVVHTTLMSNDTVDISVHYNKVINELPERYLSVTIDAGTLRRHWETFDFNSERLRNLASALAPAYLRFGGNDAECIVFDRGQYGRKWLDKIQTTNFTMTTSDWDKLNMFALNVGWQLMFDFNAFMRRGAFWDATQAIEMLEYSIKQNYTDNLAFQLGNEPDLYASEYKVKISPEQGARDVLYLNRILKKLSGGRFARSVLVGPDLAATFTHYLPKYLKVIAKDSPLHAITWHHYYMAAGKATLAAFLSPSTLDQLAGQIGEVWAQVSQGGMAGARVWLGETSTAYNSGAPGLSDRYAAGFLWLDKLGIAASHGMSMVIRQTFYGEHYSLIDTDLQPLPDYWLSLLYKRLVGNRVFAVNVSDAGGFVRVYAHCTHQSRSSYPSGALTVYALNLHLHPVTLRFSGGLRGLPKDQYLLTPYGSLGLKSKQVALNGKLLSLVGDVTLPELPPLPLPTPRSATLPSRSFAFYVFPTAGVKACARSA